jgi:hypothetical protein
MLFVILTCTSKVIFEWIIEHLKIMIDGRPLNSNSMINEQLQKEKEIHTGDRFYVKKNITN